MWNKLENSVTDESIRRNVLYGGRWIADGRWTELDWTANKVIQLPILNGDMLLIFHLFPS